MTSVLWFQGGACSGNTMSFINAAEPSVVDLIVDYGLEIVYHPTLSMEIGQTAQDLFTQRGLEVDQGHDQPTLVDPVDLADVRIAERGDADPLARRRGIGHSQHVAPVRSRHEHGDAPAVGRQLHL